MCAARAAAIVAAASRHAANKSLVVWSCIATPKSNSAMASITIVCPSQPSCTPRLVRNAGALAAAGHDVTVVSPVVGVENIEEDNRIAAKAQWDYRGVQILHPHGRCIPILPRLLRRSAYEVASRLGVACLGSTALIYGYRALIKAADTKADFYLGQQQCTLPIVASLGKRYGKPYGCDIEDILAESTREPQRLIRAIEKTYLAGASAILTMSRAAMDHLDNQYDLKIRPTIAHNCSPLAERGQLAKPASLSSRPTIYWFGQTLGPHSCALELLEANIAAGSPCKIFLRGRPVPLYLEKLIKLAKSAAVPDILEILPIVPPDIMVSECAKFDVLFGSQPSVELFHQLAIGNKVFTGIVAGCALLLEDTIAHRIINQEMSVCSTVVSYRDRAQLQAVLADYALDRDRLIRQRRAAWDLGSSTYNWECESLKVVVAVSRALESTSHCL